jgi:hypothetical protein
MTTAKQTVPEPHVLITPKFGGATRIPAITHIAKGIDIESLYNDDNEEARNVAIDDLQNEISSLTGWKIEQFRPFYSDGAPPEARTKSGA